MLSDFSKPPPHLERPSVISATCLAVLLSSAGLRSSANESGGQSAPFVARLKEILWLQKINVG
jgi:hypothetical protein